MAECQRRVHDLIDLQLCSAGVEAAIKAHDYETGEIKNYNITWVMSIQSLVDLQICRLCYISYEIKNVYSLFIGSKCRLRNIVATGYI